MRPDSFAELAPATMAIGGAALLGFLAAGALVRRDLAPAAGLKSAPQRLLLGAALTLGVTAGSIKLAIIVALSLASGAPAPPPRAAVEAQRIESTPQPAPNVWRDLPPFEPAPDPKIAALGRRLFFDAALSVDGTLACASCHDLAAKAGADGRRRARGVGGREGQRNTPTVYNVAYQTRLFWDGRATSLEEQALGPIVNPAEMGQPTIADAVAKIDTDDYRAAFALAFGDDRIDAARLAAALAAFERTLVTADTPYDRFLRGEADAMSARQLRGMARFEALGCSLCHSGPNFSGASRFTPQRPLAPLMAQGTRLEATLGRDKGAAGPGAGNGLFRVPSLRNVALTAPYLHDGSVDDLEEVVRIMGELQARADFIGDGPAPAPAWLPQQRRFAAQTRKTMSTEDVADIVAFLHALTSDGLSRSAR
jgi:cytochrome c peroxidase